MRARWLESGLFHPEAAGDAAENYSIAIPLPNVTGALHMGHALNGSVQDTLIRLARMRGQADEVDLRHRPRGHRHADAGRAPADVRGHQPRGARAARRSSSASGAGATSTAPRSSSSSSGSARRADYEDERFTLDPAYARAVQKVFVDLYDKGLIYRDNRMVNWDPGIALGDLRPRGRGPRGHRHPLLRRLPARERPRVGHGRDRAAGDDARRHRDRRPSRRRPLHAPDRRDRDPAARRPAPEDHRRRVRQARVRHRRAEDHARPRPERLRDRPRARARRDHRHRRGRAHDRGGRRALRRHDRCSRRARRSSRRCAPRAGSRGPSSSSTASRTRSARASGSSR